MHIQPLPPQGYLKDCFQYTESGSLIWKQRPAEHFNSKRGHSIFTKQTSGKTVGCSSETGYISVTLQYNNKRLSLRLHRIIWTLFNGAIPDGYYIDHKDTNIRNNKIDNLRLALPTENSRNLLVHKDSTSKVKGVSYAKRDNRWLAHITVNYNQVILGRFATREEAVVCILNNRKNFHLDFSNNG